MSQSDALSPILIILPTYNEAENIRSLPLDVLSCLDRPDVHVLVVDDNSKDGTGDIVKDLGRDDARIHLLGRPGKMGLGTAYLAGFGYALENGYAAALTMDADYSHSPEHLPAVIAALQDKADIAIGSRYVDGGGISNWPAHRKALSWGANRLARWVIGVRARDCTSGYRAYRRPWLERLTGADITSDGYSFLIEALWLCEQAGARVNEAPIHFVDRRGGVSKISHKEIFKAFGTLWRLFLKRLRGRGADAA